MSTKGEKKKYLNRQFEIETNGAGLNTDIKKINREC